MAEDSSTPPEERGGTVPVPEGESPEAIIVGEVEETEPGVVEVEVE